MGHKFQKADFFSGCIGAAVAVVVACVGVVVIVVMVAAVAAAVAASSVIAFVLLAPNWSVQKNFLVVNLLQQT